MKNLKILRTQKELGLSQCRSIGVQVANGEVIAFIDDDVCIHSSWFSEMMFWLKKLNAGAVTGVPELIPKSTARKYRQLLNRISLDLEELPKPVNCLHTGSCLIRTELVKDIQIPKWLQHREDLYITEHIKAKGYECYIVPVKFKHYAGGTWESLYAENIANLRMLGKLNAKKYLIKILGTWLVTAKIVAKLKEPQAILWNIPHMKAVIKGFNWRKYLYVKP